MKKRLWWLIADLLDRSSEVFTDLGNRAKVRAVWVEPSDSSLADDPSGDMTELIPALKKIGDYSDLSNLQIGEVTK